ncbi:MAG TPA: hypothetical protein PLP74_14055, partial [Quisquiliibacterium sp.]|nr:hypothetical protein [Quisquiliibacterium sp.]
RAPAAPVVQGARPGALFFGPFKRPRHTGRRPGMGLATTSTKVSVKSKIPRKINTIDKKRDER